MRTRKRIVGFTMALAAGAALAAAHTPSAVVVDRGLHRQWIVVRDDAHPERPPRLVEVPWSDTRAERAQPRAVTPSAIHRGAPLVRPGMTVAVVRSGGNAEWHLSGTALEIGWSGDTVRVEAGLHGAAERCVVRGPALVELVPGKARN